jgi:hypothetical protein
MKEIVKKIVDNYQELINQLGTTYNNDKQFIESAYQAKNVDLSEVQNRMEDTRKNYLKLEKAKLEKKYFEETYLKNES